MRDNISIICSKFVGDVEFGRMLKTEFLERGIICSEGNDDSETVVYVWDVADDELSERVALSPARRKILCFHELSGEYGADVILLRRPFETEDFIEYVKYEDEGSRDAPLTFGLTVNQATGQVYFSGKELMLSPTEKKLLLLLYGKRGHAVSKAEILGEVFSEQTDGNGSAPEVFINYLRKKIDNRYGIKYIYTVRGKGYMIK